MAQRKTERLLNLFIALLTSRRFLAKRTLREWFYSGQSDAAFERQFERDKDELRDMGVVIETGWDARADEEGYRVNSSDVLLPPVEFTAAERAALTMAVRVWRHTEAADQAAAAFRKLRAAGVEEQSANLPTISTVVGSVPAAFDPVWRATLAHTIIDFDYRAQPRRVRPWRMFLRTGAWYLLGFDETRDDARTFKLARITSSVTPAPDQIAYEVPDKGVLDSYAERIEPPPPVADAVVALAENRAPALRRRARPCDEAHEVPDGFGVHLVAYRDVADLADEICGAGPDAILLAPPEARDLVIARLIRLAGEVA